MTEILLSLKGNDKGEGRETGTAMIREPDKQPYFQGSSAESFHPPALEDSGLGAHEF